MYIQHENIRLDDGKPVDGRANKVHYDLGTEFFL